MREHGQGPLEGIAARKGGRQLQWQKGELPGTELQHLELVPGAAGAQKLALAIGFRKARVDVHHAFCRARGDAWSHTAV